MDTEVLVDKILKDLDEDQREAVVSTEGPLLIVAGPGSGKTRVITYRFAYIVLSKRALPTQILCVTFTNKAANEMRTRISNLTGVSDTNAWWIKTFHSLGLSILRENYYLLGLDKNFVVYDKDDQLRLIKNITKKYGFNELSPEKIMEIIDDVRYGYDTIETFGEVIRELVKIYEEELRKNNAVDFVDLIALPCKLLKTDKDIREIYQKRWKYLMIDEFQDTDPLQYEFIKLILNEDKNICVVGDDDQSIYGWRGANVENIRNFDKDFKNCKIVVLKTNYRSTEEIIRFSNSVSSNMLFRRKEKKIKGIGTRGDLPVFIETYDQRKEAYIIAKEIKFFVQNGFNYRDIAVFYRTNYLSRILEEVFIEERIPYKVYSGISFYERAEIKDILAYIKFFVNRNDFVSFSRIINVPKRGIGESAVSKIYDYALRTGKDFLSATLELREKGGIKGEISSFVEAIKILENENIGLASRVKKLIEKIGYYDHLKRVYDNYEERIENVEELIGAIMDFEDNGGKSFEEFVNNSTLMTNSDEVDENLNSVSLMTLHVSKGLEFPIVFIFSAVDGIIPHSRNIHNPSLLDEERRLFYVGITRAKKKLIITASRFVRIGSNKHSFVSPTRFIEEIPPEIIRVVRV